MISSAACSWYPNMRIASGISATDGIGRRNSTVVWVARRRNGTSPMTVPSTTASTVAITSPSAHDVRVRPTLRQNSRSRTWSPSAARVAVAVGKYAGFTIPSVGSNCQVTRKPTMPARPRATLRRVRSRRALRPLRRLGGDAATAGASARAMRVRSGRKAGGRQAEGVDAAGRGIHSLLLPLLLLDQRVVVGLGVDVLELDGEGAQVLDAGVGEVPRERRQGDAGSGLGRDLEVGRDRGAHRILVVGGP